jgi:tetratricopeptide (TPR) repeat protein
VDIDLDKVLAKEGRVAEGRDVDEIDRDVQLVRECFGEFGINTTNARRMLRRILPRGMSESDLERGRLRRSSESRECHRRPTKRNTTKRSIHLLRRSGSTQITPSPTAIEVAHTTTKATMRTHSAILSDAIRLDSSLALAYNSRGIAYAGQGSLDKAIGDYSEAIRLDPNFTWAYANRGFVYYQQREFDKAISDCNEAIRLTLSTPLPTAIAETPMFTKVNTLWRSATTTTRSGSTLVMPQPTTIAE